MLPPVPLDKIKRRNVYERIQSRMQFKDVFPIPRKGRCRCGCPRPVVRPRRLWATHQCSQNAVKYYEVIKGRQSTVRRLLYQRDKGICANCGTKCFHQDWQADHILEVVNGGGGCDLTNYQTLCILCHKVKTKNLKRIAR